MWKGNSNTPDFISDEIGIKKELGTEIKKQIKMDQVNNNWEEY